jgi:DNA polymerase I-like protein with 3'-5' exonuclease and polymerase domains
VSKTIVIDIETTGGQPQDGGLLTLSWQYPGEAHAHVAQPDDVPDWVWADLADPTCTVVSHTKYDARYLRLCGHSVTGPFHDTQVMAWVLNENQQLSLEALARRYCQVAMDKRLVVRNGEVFFKTDEGPVVGIEEAPAEQLYAYNARDVEATTDLYLTLWERLDDTEWLEYFLERAKFTEALLDMECEGLPIDLEASEALREELELTHEEMQLNLLAAAGLPEDFNLNSGQQLAAYLFHRTFEMTASLDLGQDAMECLKSCLDGEHEDCPSMADDMHMHENLAGEQEECTENDCPDYYHVLDLLPEGFVLDKLGRTQVHGRYTLKGLGLTWKTAAPKCERGECDCGGLHKPSTASTALKTNVATASDPWVQEYLGFRKVDKLLTTYLRKFPRVAREGRIYARFNQTGTKTGRLSSSEPNLQNIPAHGDLGERTRALFTGSEERMLVVGDYSQLEPRLMAHFSQDPRLLDIYRSDKDIYLETAHGIFGREDIEKDDPERGIAKTLVLAMGYGAGPQKVADILTINGFPSDKQTAKGYLAELHELYAPFFNWREQVIAGVKRRGYVQTMGGRHRRLKAAFADRRNFKNIGYGERQAVNAIVQGTAGDLFESLTVGWRSARLPMLCQVHDEGIWQYRRPATRGEVQADLRSLALFATEGHGYKLNVPLKFEPNLCMTWADKGTTVYLELPHGLSAETTVEFEEER